MLLTFLSSMFSIFLQRENIPKDYKIPVHFVPKEEVRMNGWFATIESVHKQ